MNKAKIKQLAADTKRTASQRPPEASGAAGRTSSAASPTASTEALQARIYAALVGGSDFLRTQAGPAEVCRLAYRRSEIAVEVWRKERAKAMEARDER